MTTLTRHSHYASLPVRNRLGGHVWTQESVLQAFALFAAEEGHYPTTRYLRAAEGLPCYERVRQLFGSLPAAMASLPRIQPPPPPPPAPPSPYARMVNCPRCGEEWKSPDVRNYRTCDSCHQDPAYGQGCWLNGAPIPRAGMEEIDAWEDTGT